MRTRPTARPGKLDKPCPTEYASEHFKGKHNIVGGYTMNGHDVPKRCCSCGATA